jgi:hypothetical protein
MSVTNCQPTKRNIQEECKPQLYRGGRLTSDIRLVYKALKGVRWEVCGLLYYLEYRMKLYSSRYYREYRLEQCRLLYYKKGRFECGLRTTWTILELHAPPYYKNNGWTYVDFCSTGFS